MSATAAVVGAKIASKLASEAIDSINDSDDEKSISGKDDIDEFFKGQIFQQSLANSSGWTTISQAMITGVSNAILDGKDIDMTSIEKIMELSSKLQNNNLEIMKKLKEVSD